MAMNSCCFGGVPSPERLSKELSYLGQSKHQGAGFAASIMQFVKCRCLLASNESKKDVQLPKNSNRSPKIKELTLEEVLSFPLENSSCYFDVDDQFHVSKQYSFNNVHPSSAEKIADYDYPSHDSDYYSNCRYSTERLLRADEVDSTGEIDFSSFSKSRSEKVKKRVSFKLPKEADILVFYSPDEEVGD